MSRVAVAAAAVVALAAGLAGGLLVGGTVLRPAAPAEGSAEVGFARDMQAHHAQAVEMSLLVRERSDDEELRQVALDIVLTQQQQQGQMYGWLAVWGLPQATTAAPMAWAEGHGHAVADGPVDSDALMPGMATTEQLDRLRSADGPAAERLFLELMIDHHLGGVAMAEAALELAERPEVRRLATAVVESQTAEVAVLESLLEQVDGAA